MVSLNNLYRQIFDIVLRPLRLLRYSNGGSLGGRLFLFIIVDIATLALLGLFGISWVRVKLGGHRWLLFLILEGLLVKNAYLLSVRV